MPPHIFLFKFYWIIQTGLLQPTTTQNIMASFQSADWDTVVFSKQGVKKSGMSQKAHINSQMRRGNVSAVNKMGKVNNSAVSRSGIIGGDANLIKLEADNESTKHQKVSRELSKAIAAARQAKSMTQKELATQMNVKPTMISQYEAGKAIPNNQFIVKLERKLGCKLPRAAKKSSSSSSSSSATSSSGMRRIVGAGSGGVVKKKKKKTKSTNGGVNNIMAGLRISR